MYNYDLNLDNQLSDDMNFPYNSMQQWQDVVFLNSIINSRQTSCIVSVLLLTYE